MPYELMTHECMHERLARGEAWPVAGFGPSLVESDGHRWTRSGDVWVREEAPAAGGRPRRPRDDHPAHPMDAGRPSPQPTAAPEPEPGRGPQTGTRRARRAAPPAEPAPVDWLQERLTTQSAPAWTDLPEQPEQPAPWTGDWAGQPAAEAPGAYWLQDARPAGEPGRRRRRGRPEQGEDEGEAGRGGRHRLPALAASTVVAAAALVLATAAQDQTQPVAQPRVQAPTALPAPLRSTPADGSAAGYSAAGPASRVADVAAAGAARRDAAGRAAGERAGSRTPRSAGDGRDDRADRTATRNAKNRKKPAKAPKTAPVSPRPTTRPAPPPSVDPLPSGPRGALTAVRNEISRAAGAGQLSGGGRTALTNDAQGVQDALDGKSGEAAEDRVTDLRKRADDLAGRNELRGAAVTSLRSAIDRLQREIQSPSTAGARTGGGASGGDAADG